LNKTLAQTGYSKAAARNASYLLPNTVGTFQGLTGLITVDDNNDRVPSEFFFIVGPLFS
jgi:hypothetical protein